MNTNKEKIMEKQEINVTRIAEKLGGLYNLV